MLLKRSFKNGELGACGVQLQPLVDALKEELLAQPVLHADETPVAMLKPGNGMTHRAYLWSHCSTVSNPMKTVLFDFAESRGGHHAGQFLNAWRGTLVCDDFSGYKALFRQGVTEAGCMAHARRKFHEPRSFPARSQNLHAHANPSENSFIRQFQSPSSNES